jgi:hypothetical protein
MAARQRGVGHGQIAAWIAAEHVLDGFEANRTAVPRPFHHDQSRHDAMIAYRRLESRLPGIAACK